jgi:mannose-6-phosphate isomerase-like protein (cupin superfamily)
MMTTVPAAPVFADFSQIAPVPCPCGQAQRGLMTPENQLCSLHTVEISINARTHYHRDHVEVYYFLEGAGELELDGVLHPLRPGQAVLIPTGVRHRAVVPPGGRMRILNYVTPPFDVADEHFD